MQTRVFLFILVLMIGIPSQGAVSQTCSALFAVSADQSKAFDHSRKIRVFSEALMHSRINVDKNNEHITEILNKWNLQDSSPAKVESIAQAVVLKLSDKKTFMQWLKEIILKGNVVKEAVRVRAQTLILKRELLDSLEIRGLLKKNSKFENYKSFRQYHFNKIQLAKMLAINSATIYFLGLPLYFPNFDWVKNLDLSDKDLYLVETKGFDNAYPFILNNHIKELRIQRITEHAPQVFFLSLATYTAYNYLLFDSVTTRYEVSTTDTIPQSHKLFIEWKNQYEERTGKSADMKNPQDRKEWDTTVQSIYRAWADMFNAKEGRYPDLSKEQDRLKWEKFLSSLES